MNSAAVRFGAHSVRPGSDYGKFTGLNHAAAILFETHSALFTLNTDRYFPLRSAAVTFGMSTVASVRGPIPGFHDAAR